MRPGDHAVIDLTIASGNVVGVGDQREAPGGEAADDLESQDRERHGQRRAEPPFAKDRLRERGDGPRFRRYAPHPTISSTVATAIG